MRVCFSVQENERVAKQKMQRDSQFSDMACSRDDGAKWEPTPPAAELDFRSAFCKKFQCSMQDFDKRVFWKCLYRHAVPLAACLYWTKREFFQPDLELIRSLASTTTFSEVRAEASFIRHDQRMQEGFLRGTLRIRISGRRLANLACSTLTT
jgi:hypothetical protein